MQYSYSTVVQYCANTNTCTVLLYKSQAAVVHYRTVPVPPVHTAVLLHDALKFTPEPPSTAPPYLFTILSVLDNKHQSHHQEVSQRNGNVAVPLPIETSITASSESSTVVI